MGERSTASPICGMCPVEVKDKVHKKRGNYDSITRIKPVKHGNNGRIDAGSPFYVVFTN